MKNYVIVCLFVFSCSGIFAQTEAGSVFVAGSTNMNATFINRTYAYSDQTLNTFKITSYNLHPTIGYFPMENLAVGLSVSWTYSKTVQPTTTQKETDLVIGPSIRYYIGHNKLKPFVTGDFGATWSRKSQMDEGIVPRDKAYAGYSYGLGLGAAYFLSEYFSLDTSIGYIGSSIKDVDDSYYTYKSSGLSLNIGFAVTL